MQLLIGLRLPLLLDIVANRFFGPMSPNRSDVITVRPEFAAPKFFLHTRHLFEDFTGRDAFDNLHDFGWTVGRNRLHQEMHMVIIRTYLDEVHFVPFADSQAHVFQDLIHFIREHDSSIFRWAHNMV